MGFQIRSLASLVILSGALTFLPTHLSQGGLSYEGAFANNAGGNGNGKGQGAAHAGSNGGGPGTNGGGLANASSNASTGSLSSTLARFNFLHALGHASPNSQIGMFAAEYSGALNAFATVDTADDPTTEQLAAIIAKYANKELTPEAIDWINQQFVSQGLVQQTTLDAASTALTPTVDPNADPTIVTVTPTFSEALSEAVSVEQQGEANQGLGGLGPIY